MVLGDAAVNPNKEKLQTLDGSSETSEPVASLHGEMLQEGRGQNPEV